MELSDIISNIDIQHFIGERIDTKKMGKHYKACCPFHDEKTPSFNIYEDSQRYHCFGCGASGDALDFVREYDRLSKADAIKYIKDYTGVVDDFKPDQTIIRKMKPERVMLAKLIAIMTYSDVHSGKATAATVVRDNVTYARVRACT